MMAVETQVVSASTRLPPILKNHNKTNLNKEGLQPSNECNDITDNQKGNSAINNPMLDGSGIYAGKFIDRSPFLQSAGKLTITGDSTRQCMNPPGRPTSPDVVKKFRATFYPEAGERKVFYGKANDPHLTWAQLMTHGINTQPSLTAGEMVNPALVPVFKQRGIDKIENTLYHSKRKAPLGKSHNQSVGFPKAYPWKDLTYGVVTVKDGNAGELVNPPKAYDAVQGEAAEGHNLYVFSHKDFDPGEQVTRKYPSAHYKKANQFGRPTPHDNTGAKTYKSLKWVHELQLQKGAKIVNKRLDDWREKFQDQLGLPRDPIKDTMKVGPDHTFGIMVKPDAYGAGDLLHGRLDTNYLRGRDHQRGVVAALRQQLKKANFQNFDNLLSAFKFYDKSDNGRINIRDLATACYQFNLPTEPELVAQVMDYCDVDKDGFINYHEFANFLNYNMPSGIVEEEVVEEADGTRRVKSSRESMPMRMKKQIDNAVGGFRTSSAMINATVDGMSTRGWRTYGTPTIRYDLPAPKSKSISDHKNYGDEATSHALVNPSIYSNKGVYDQDFMLPRDKENIREIFTNIGAHMTLQQFDEIYDEAAKRHPKRHVSIESFRSILDEIRAAEVVETEHELKSELQL